MDHYTHDGLTFEVTDSGPANGRTVILLHGFPEDRECWTGLAEQLDQRRLPGVGAGSAGLLAGGPPEGRRAYTVDQLAGDVLALADAAGAHRFDVVGHDWGAVVAWHLAGVHPDRARSLTALSVPHPGAMSEALTRSPQALRSWYMLFFQIPALPERSLSWSGGARLADQLERHRPRCRLGPPVRQAGGDPGALTGPLNWYRALPFDRRHPVGPVAVPTLFVWGDRDRFVTRGGRRAVAAGTSPDRSRSSPCMRPITGCRPAGPTRGPIAAAPSGRCRRRVTPPTSGAQPPRGPSDAAPPRCQHPNGEPTATSPGPGPRFVAAGALAWPP